MGATRTPIAALFFHRPHRFVLRREFGFWRIPQLSAREPFDDDVLVRASELSDRRKQLLFVVRTEGGWLAVYEDRPVHETRWHRSILLLKPLQLLDERRPLQVQERRRLAFVAPGAFERSLNQVAFDVGDEGVEVEPLFGQHHRR